MKQYNNGPRKGMMYGGMSRRKPMMYGGSTKKMQMGGQAMAVPKKKMDAAAMPMTNPMMPVSPMTTSQQRTPMAMGSKALKMVEKDGKKVPFYAADGVGKMKRGGKAKKNGY